MADQEELDSFLTRKEFIELAAKGLVFVILAAFLRLQERGKYYPRPPGARREEVFLSLCIRCDRCREACPWDVIEPVSLTESWIHVNTPVLAGYCRDCNLCIEACPTGALR